MRVLKLNSGGLIALLVIEVFTADPVLLAGDLERPQVPLQPQVFRDLQKDLQKSYLDLFRLASTLEYSPEQLDAMRDYLTKAKHYCSATFHSQSEDYERQLHETQGDLKRRSAEITDAQRHELHCQIQSSWIMRDETNTLSEHAIPIAYQNKEAKLDLIEKWPAEFQQIQQEIASGSYHNRRWGDVQDIGFRDIEPGQKDDIKVGEKAVDQMKTADLLPPEVPDKEIVDYVTKVAKQVASHSDLKVPLHVRVLNAKEINAFALPGGFLFVERGLLEAADDESQLAGVLGHEIAHVVARHGHKLMKKGTIAGILFQAAEIAAMVLTGGAAGIGTYYALQYGFYGLGLLLDLSLLGVSRDFEEQADQLGIQYAWNSGYDPSGFIRFFDKMATKMGYVEGASWFRDHPPFYERMVNAEREIDFLPKKDQLVVQTADFKAMKEHLDKLVAKIDRESKTRSEMLMREKGCQAPHKYDYKPGESVETLCSLPAE